MLLVRLRAVAQLRVDGVEVVLGAVRICFVILGVHETCVQSVDAMGRVRGPAGLATHSKAIISDRGCAAELRILLVPASYAGVMTPQRRHATVHRALKRC